MKNIFIVLFLLIIFWQCASEKEKLGSNIPKIKFVDSLIQQMTIEEKVGQMTNLTLEVLLKQKEDPLEFDQDKLKNIFVNHHVGSIQNTPYHAYSLKEWHYIVNTIQRYTLDNTRLKIPSLYCIDAVHGTNYTSGSTLFPHNIALAATRNPELVKEGAAITAKETRASGIRYNFSPVLDIGLQPLWPRFPETFGEDVLIVKQMGIASVQGYEGNDIGQPDKVACCMKHYIGYSKPYSGRDRSPALIPERELREKFLPSFAAAVKQGAHTLMVNSGEVNGTPVHASKYLLTDVLRGELGYEGVIISDWQDILKLHTLHHVAASHKEAVYKSIMAGIDLVIVPFDFDFSIDLIALVKEGKISESRINESVKRILLLKYDLGLWKNPYVEEAAVKNFGLSSYKEVALNAARESMTLLKNEKNILPRSKNENILIIGPAGNSRTALNGCWSYTWQGSDPKYTNPEMLTVYEAFAKIQGKEKVRYVKGSDFEGGTVSEQEIKKNVSWADVIIVCIGEEAYAEQEGNITDLELPEVQQELVRKVKALGKPVVLVLIEGRPRLIQKIEPMADAILMAYWPSEKGGEAIAETILGINNPSGRLPFTYPKSANYILPYDHKLLDEKWENTKYDFAFLYPFGHGLSYTTFNYEQLIVSKDTLLQNDTLTVTIQLTNTGKMNGKETVELYMRDHYASITPPVRKLIAFKKIELQVGETKSVTFKITSEDLSFVDESMKWISETGDFTLSVNGLSKVFYLKK